ncbi:MAG: hypothetical protein RL335_564 [Bacteroidota bacterium]
MLSDAMYMQRAIELAKRGAGYVAPNPLVGAVLVHNGRIIGEGWHETYGEAHAEVNCINSVKEQDKALISTSILYVTLEPCSHFGKTPPCTDLIIDHNIQKMVIGNLDPFADVNGKGVERLREAGIDVITGVEANACAEMNKRFLTFHTEGRPYIVLKWAQTADLKVAGSSEERLLISGDLTNRLVHKWRSEESAILVGTNTALLDDPALTTRLWSGRHPVRAVVDMDLRLPSHLKLFNRRSPTIVFNTHRHEEQENLYLYQVSRGSSLVHQIVQAFFNVQLQSVLVEGGVLLLQSFIEAGLWDEIRITTNKDMLSPRGLTAPALPDAFKVDEISLGSDVITTYRQV